MPRHVGTTSLALALLSSTAIAANAEVFNRIATFHVEDNLPADADPAGSVVLALSAPQPARTRSTAAAAGASARVNLRVLIRTLLRG